jgi:hypothetical protein
MSWFWTPFAHRQVDSVAKLFYRSGKQNFEGNPDGNHHLY